MISRYTRPEMAAIWEAQTRFKIWFEIEAHAADALAELGRHPEGSRRTIWAKARDAIFDVARIDEIERETKHDVIAFLTHLAEIVGPEARFVHQGMTSSDVLDTCLNVQLTRAADLLIDDVDKVLAALKKRAFEHKMTPDHRPLPRHPCRAGDVRAEARLCLCGIRPRPRAAASPRARKSRPARSRARSAPSPRSIRAVEEHVAQSDGADAGADLDAGDPARPPRDVFCDAGRDRLLGRAARHRDPASAAHRSAGGGGVLLRGPEGLLGDAAQAQPGAVGKPHRPLAHGARLCDAGDGERRAVARARHLALLGRAHDRARTPR